jgi:acetylglutamate kinase
VQRRLAQNTVPAAGLGVKLVVVVGVRMQINKHVLGEGVEPRYVSGYRVTDSVTMMAAIEEAGKARMEIEARLSKVWGLGERKG